MNAPAFTHLEEWFPRAPADGRYLRLWREAPLTYQPGQALDSTWHVDDYAVTLGVDATAQLFDRAINMLMRYRFYPADVMRAISDFELERRWLRPGDRIVQRLHIFRLPNLPLLDVVTMNEITSVVNEDRRKGFTYATTECHAEQGEWSALIDWHASGEVRLTMHAVSRPGPRLLIWAYGLARHLQLRAHQRGLASFRRRVLDPI